MVQKVDSAIGVVGDVRDVVGRPGDGGAGADCILDGTARRAARGSSCPMLALPYIPSIVSWSCSLRTPSPSTRPSLLCPLLFVRVVRLLLRIKWRTGTSTGVFSLDGASMLLRSVHRSDGPASRTTKNGKNGRIVKDKLRTCRTWILRAAERAFDALETDVRVETFQGVEDAAVHW